MRIEIPHNKVFNTSFAERFAFNVDMLNYRINRLLAIDTFQKENMQEYQMVFDATMTLFRSIFLENRNVNYTMQNYFTLTGRQETADKLNELFDQPFTAYMDKSIRDVLKFIIDKFVCHQDKITYEEIGLCNAWMANLNNPYFEINLSHIVEEINKIIDNAPRLQLNDNE